MTTETIIQNLVNEMKLAEKRYADGGLKRSNVLYTMNTLYRGETIYESIRPALPYIIDLIIALSKKQIDISDLNIINHCRWICS